MSAKISHIILGIDFSEYSRSVLKQARLLASSMKVPLVLVHAFQDPIQNDWQESWACSEINKILKARAKAYYGLKDESLLIRRGKPYKQILAVAKLFTSPLILVGHRGESGVVERFFLGSTAERLSLKTNFPLLIFRGKSFSNIRKILIPTDLSDRAKMTLKGLKTMGFKKLNIELYHVMTPPPPIFDFDDWSMLYADYKEDYRKSVDKLRKRFSPIKLTVVMANNPAIEIKKKAQNYDLIAISPSEKKGFLSNLGSTTTKVVRSGTTSILVVP